MRASWERVYVADRVAAGPRCQPGRLSHRDLHGRRLSEQALRVETEGFQNVGIQYQPAVRRTIRVQPEAVVPSPERPSNAPALELDTDVPDPCEPILPRRRAARTEFSREDRHPVDLPPLAHAIESRAKPVDSNPPRRCLPPFARDRRRPTPLRGSPRPPDCPLRPLLPQSARPWD